MATENLKSGVITALDATPVTHGGVGATDGAGRRLVFADAAGITATSGVTSGSTYQMVRIPSNCYVKRIRACIDAAVTTFTADIGLYYSTSHIDGTKQSNVADVVSGTTGPTVIDQDFFASAVALASVVTPTEYTDESGTYTAAKRLQPIWQAAGLSADPGGYFDVAFTITATTNDNSVALKPYLSVEYTVH